MFYEDTMPTIKDALLRIFDELIRVSHQMSRPETTLRKSEKQFLPEMTMEDERYRIIRWAYDGMIKNCEELFKQIQGSL